MKVKYRLENGDRVAALEKEGLVLLRKGASLTRR